MPRAKKAKLQEKAKAPDEVLTEFSTDEETLLNAFDAWTHVFLSSFVAMEDPIRQLRVEHDDLEYQWGRFLRGQEGLDTDSKFRFLENHHILEFAPEEDFIKRHDLAVMVRDLFMRDLERTRIDLGLSGYIRMFRPQLDDSAAVTVDDSGMYWKTLMQLVCLVMALCMCDGQDMSGYSPVDDLSRRWAQKTRTSLNSTANLQRISDSVMASMFDIAMRAAEDRKRLYGLYQNTLKMIIIQLEEVLQELNPPDNEDGLVDDLMKIRNQQVAELCRKSERLGHAAIEDVDADWFEGPGGVVFGSGDVQMEESESQEAWEQFPTPQQPEEEAAESQENQGAEQESMHDKGEMECEEQKLEPATLDEDIEWSGEEEDDKEERHSSVDEAEEASHGRKADSEVVEEDEEEDEPLERRYLKSRKAFDSYTKPQDGEGSSSGRPKGKAISFARPGFDNIAQGSLLLSKSVQEKAASARIQDASSHVTKTAAPSTAPQQDSAPPQLQQITEQEPESTLKQADDEVQDRTPQPQVQPLSIFKQPDSNGQLQSEPDPFISKTKRVFRAPSESEFEDDGEDIPFRELKKKKQVSQESLLSRGSQPTPPLSDHRPSPAPDHGHDDGGVSSSSSSSKDLGSSNLFGWLSSNTATATATTTTTGPAGRSGPPVTDVAQILQSRPKAAAKEKRKYRPWTKTEVDRLMELAPRFFHDQPAACVGEGGKKKRNVKWAQLKAYDEHHGNLLKHRTQVNLKDKYREKTDDGQHRQEINLHLRAKAEAVPQHKFSTPKRGL
ncbi:hypothetical protein BGX23_002412 [Mortierella sp. AD031]|nr:hypothetical protein BGX23_002412 [Mortierella sp. AD031]KAG0217296.1 hypothetical protein BGX33_010942 [Mortierella sp. NVP41]